MDWTTYYPAFACPAENAKHAAQKTGSLQREVPKISKDITTADIGCGFGGLLVALAPLLPEELMLGIACRMLTKTIADFAKVWK